MSQSQSGVVQCSTIIQRIQIEQKNTECPHVERKYHKVELCIQISVKIQSMIQIEQEYEGRVMYPNTGPPKRVQM